MKQGFVIKGNTHYLYNFTTHEECGFDAYGDFKSLGTLSNLYPEVKEVCLLSLLGTNTFCDICVGESHYVFQGISVIDMQKRLRSLDAFKANMVSIIPYRVSHSSEGFVGLNHIMFVMKPDFRAGSISKLLNDIGITNSIQEWVEITCARN